jgi:uncharacterized membrane protein YcaP (DUF421 family)
MQEWLDILLRSFFLFVLVFLAVRFMGKKHPAKMTPFAFINYAVIAVITSLLVLKLMPNIILGLVALLVWVALPVIADHLALRSKAVHDFVHGKETVLIKQGKIMEDNLKQARMSGEELLGSLRVKNVFNAADVEFAVLEASGDINVLLKSDKLPITAKDLEWKVSAQTEPQTVILDGNILNEPLTEMGLNYSWLHTQLVDTGISLDNVFMGQVDSNGELYLDLFDDSIQMPKAKVRELLYANLEKSQADLMSFALETSDEQAKKMYAVNAENLKKLMERLQPYLLR